MIGWRFDDNLCFLAEGSNHDTSSVIEWAKNMSNEILFICFHITRTFNDIFWLLDLFNDPNETSDIANSVTDIDYNLFFVPGFFGLQAPILDAKAAAGLIGY